MYDEQLDKISGKKFEEFLSHEEIYKITKKVLPSLKDSFFVPISI